VAEDVREEVIIAEPSRFDSLRQQTEEDEAHRLVSAAQVGAACSGGATTRPTVALGRV
jgi:hypothetical protein